MISLFLLNQVHFVTTQMTMLCIVHTKTLILQSADSKYDFALISEWFHKNHVVLNPGKCHFLTLGLMNHFQIFLSTILQFKMLPRKVFFG